jgi:hypothetical protein
VLAANQKATAVADSVSSSWSPQHAALPFLVRNPSPAKRAAAYANEI